MPQLQVINTGASPLNTALGNIGSGFIQQFNQRQEQARNDEIFSRIKSKYGPNADADTVYKDILQSSGFDQSYKNNLLKMVSDYAALQRDKEKTNYEKIRLDQYQEQLGISKKNSDVAAQNAKNKEIQTQINAAKLENDLKNNPNKVASGFSKLVGDYYKTGNVKLKPNDRAIIEKAGLEALKNGATPQDALLTGQQVLDNYTKALNSITPPVSPTRSNFGFAPDPKEVQQAQQGLYQTLFNAFLSGVKNPEDLRTIAKKGQWSENVYNPMIQKILLNPNKAVPDEQVLQIFAQ